MLLIYSHTLTARIHYVMNVVFKHVLMTPFQLTNDLDEFNKSELPKLAYTKVNRGFTFFIQSNDLLFETEIRKILPEADQKFIDFPLFFKSDINDYLGYDIFAMVFYFASRYEEYLETQQDEHGRFKAENSLAFCYGCLRTPFLNNAIQQFGDKLLQTYPALKFGKRDFNFLSTIDIDNAFAFAHKGFVRNMGGFAKEVLSLNFNQVKQRIVSNLNDGNDPYNTFEFINSLSKETQTALHYFVLIGDYSSYDKNPHYQNNRFRKLLKSLSSEHPIGLHPSYNSFDHSEKIEIEKKRLEDIIEKKVTSARCHFLRIKFPDTYRQFIKSGITDDYTMIYASQPGFRNGLCTPVPWFDLEKNESTALMIHPSSFMEGTLRDYNKYSPVKANEVIDELLNKVKNHGGEFISIFHNDSFIREQKEWIEVYKELLKSSLRRSHIHN